MYRRHPNYWSIIGLFLTLVQALWLWASFDWTAAPVNQDVKCLFGRIEVECRGVYRLQ